MNLPKKRIGHHLIAAGVYVWLVLAVVVNFVPGKAFAVSSGELFSLSNQERLNNGLVAYRSNSKLSSSAQAKANHMLANGYFAHTAPDGTTPWSFIVNAGYSYAGAGENLAAGNQGADAIVQGWMNSSGHRANLLSKTYTEVGYGVVYVGEWNYQGVTYSNTYFVVAHYAAPTASTAQASNPEPNDSAQQSATEPTSTSSSPSSANNTTPETDTGVEAEVSDTPKTETEQAALSSTEPDLSEQASGFPLASVAEVDKPLVEPWLAVLLATVAAGVVAAGVLLEVRYIRHHAHLDMHLPHIHI
ncbi:hypothetical protein KC878_04315 [Candidatus Saccharibacteria bacterium]|nr:hypothetical protein [Candidatus Saccharibacteria bacterium]MCB9821609.1 hypothetical protein [Candidatus Nomurabacteria bacterium]